MGRSMRPAASVVGSSWLLPLPLTYFAFIIISIGTLDADPNAKFWIWLPALAIIDISVAATGIHLLVSGLRRRGAVAASLMMAVMVWPFLMLVDATSLILQDGMSVTLMSHEGAPISVTLPEQVVVTVVEADAVVKGQTASSSYKPATVDNGQRVMVPPHIETGTRIVVKTEDGSYVERAKD